MPEGSPLPKALVDAYGGAPPWRKLVAWGGVFLLGLLVLVLALGSRAGAPESAAWWTLPGMVLGGVLMLASLVVVAFDLPRRRASAPDGIGDD